MSAGSDGVTDLLVENLLFLRVGPIQLSQMRATDPNNVELLPAGGIITVALFLGSSQ